MFVNFHVIGEVDKDFVYRIDDNVVLRNVLFVYLVNFAARLYILRHSRLSDNETDFFRRVVFKFFVHERLAVKLPAGRVFEPLSVHFADALNDFEKPRSARNAVRFERRRNGKTYRFFRPRLIRDDEIYTERIEFSLHAFNRSEKRFKIDRGVYSVFIFRHINLSLRVITPNVAI